MPLRIIPDNTRIRFMSMRRYTFPVTALLTIAAVALFIFVGPNYGIDFRGGTMVVLQAPDGAVEAADIAEVRSRLDAMNLGDVSVQTLTELGGAQSISIRIQLQEGGDAAQAQLVNDLRQSLSDVGDVRSVEAVGARVSGELARNGIVAALIAMTAIMIYVWLRFEWQFAIGAIIATLHDVLMTLGFFAVVKFDFNLSSIAAILTIVGYSLNDTVVVYDRIRETLRKYKQMPIAELIDRAINETLARTTITSLTTWLVLWALFFFGGTVIQSFVAAMIFGIAIGTYSSIFIAAPVLIYFRVRGGQPGQTHEASPRAPSAESPETAKK